MFGWHGHASIRTIYVAATEFQSASLPTPTWNASVERLTLILHNKIQQIQERSGEYKDTPRAMVWECFGHGSVVSSNQVTLVDSDWLNCMISNKTTPSNLLATNLIDMELISIYFNLSSHSKVQN
jgi:hypothetical protein